VKTSFEYQIRLLSRAMLLSVSYAALGRYDGSARGPSPRRLPAEQRTSEAAPALPPVHGHGARKQTSRQSRARHPAPTTARVDAGRRPHGGRRRPRRQRSSRRRRMPAPARSASTANKHVGGDQGPTRRWSTFRSRLASSPRTSSGDQNFQGLTDVTRYVPGVAVHQGRRQSRRTGDPGRGFERQFLRQRPSVTTSSTSAISTTRKASRY